MKRAGFIRLAFAFIAGIATVFGFAPFGLFALPVVTVALYILLVQDAASPRAAGWTGFAFAIGLFGAGGSWVFIALNTFGGMPWPLAAGGTAAFCAYISLYSAAAAWIAVRWTPRSSWQRALAVAATWTIAEWAHSIGFASFPWLALGYAEITQTSVSPLAGWAPMGGVFSVTLAIAMAGAMLAIGVDAFVAAAYRRVASCAVGFVLIVVLGMAAGRIEWTTPTGAPVAVSLIQGNVQQDEKFDPERRDATFDLYLRLLDASRGRLVVLPESAFPVFADEVPDAIWRRLAASMRERNGDVLVGMFTIDPPLVADGEPRYYNSVVSVGTAKLQLYRKRHLVPFGETIPFEPVVGWFIRQVLAIPLANQTPGTDAQPAFAIAGQRVAVDICYEDAFGADIRPQAETATLLVNVTNDAWYGRSLAAPQHNQIASMRALETGRPLLRATNTGITSAIDYNGIELARLPWFREATLEIEVTGRTGLTPFVRVGNAPVVLIALVLFAAVAFLSPDRLRR